MKDALVLFPSDQECPCKSGLTAGICCFRESPPIIEDAVRFNSLQLEAEWVDQLGFVRRVPSNVQFQIEINQPGQIENQIERIAQQALTKIELSSDVPKTEAVELLRPYTKRVTSLTDAMYSCRYHEIQFLFRLSRLVKQQILEFNPPNSRHAIRIHDRPLRIELESFLISTISALDMLSEVIRLRLRIRKKHDSFKKLAEHLGLHHSDGNNQTMKNILCSANESWAQRVRSIRNLIVHEASFSAFQGIGHQAMLLLDAEIAGIPAGEFAVKTWHEFRELAIRAIEVAPPYRVGFDTGKESELY